MDRKRSGKEKFLFVTDVMFVMILCFVVLLITMLIQNSAGTADTAQGYVIDFRIFIPVVAILAVYTIFLVCRSRRDLKEIVALTYDKQEEKDDARGEQQTDSQNEMDRIR